MRWLDGMIDSMDMSLSKLRDSEGQGSLACCSPWGCKESDMTERLNNHQHPLARGYPHSSSQDVDRPFGNKCSGTPDFVIQSTEDMRALPS